MDSEINSSVIDDALSYAGSIQDSVSSKQTEIQGSSYLQGLMKRYASPNKKYEFAQNISPNAKSNNFKGKMNGG